MCAIQTFMYIEGELLNTLWFEMFDTQHIKLLNKNDLRTHIELNTEGGKGEAVYFCVGVKKK